MDNQITGTTMEKAERFYRAFGENIMMTVELEIPNKIQREFHNPSVVQVKSFNPDDLLNAMPWIDRLCVIRRTVKNGHLADDLAEIWHFYPDENIVEMELLLERKTAAVNIFTCSPKPPLRSIKSEKKKNADTVSDIFVGTASTARTQAIPAVHS